MQHFILMVTNICIINFHFKFYDLLMRFAILVIYFPVIQRQVGDWFELSPLSFGFLKTRWLNLFVY